MALGRLSKRENLHRAQCKRNSTPSTRLWTSPRVPRKRTHDDTGGSHPQQFPLSPTATKGETNESERSLLGESASQRLSRKRRRAGWDDDRVGKRRRRRAGAYCFFVGLNMSPRLSRRSEKSSSSFSRSKRCCRCSQASWVPGSTTWENKAANDAEKSRDTPPHTQRPG